MPPHCDSIDGPVVTAAREALESQEVGLILPYVPKEGEGEIKKAFEQVIAARQSDSTLITELADTYFFETVVRVHRAGEGAPYTGLKPAGLDVGPVIPVAEKAIETGEVDELTSLLCDLVRKEVEHRFERMMHLRQHTSHGVDAAREYVEAMLGLQVWSHKLYLAAKARPHENAGEHEHG